MKILEAIKKVLKSNDVADDLTEKIANEVEVELEPEAKADEVVETKDEVETEPVEKKEDETKTETDEPEAETKSEGENADAPVDEKPDDEVKVEETTETTEKADEAEDDKNDLAKEYMAKYEEVKSALDGVSARLSSLEEALNNSGVLTKQEATEIGVGYGDNNDVEHGKSMSDILARLNRIR